jgi:ABC-2 type transport system permease protein
MFRKQLWLVAKQTFKTRVRSVGFWGVVLSPILLLGVVFGISALMAWSQSNQSATVGIVNDKQVTTYLKASKSVDYSFKNIDSVSQANKQLDKGALDGYIEETDGGYKLTTTLDSQPIATDALQPVLSSYLLAVRGGQMNLSADQLRELLAPAKISNVVKSDKGSQDGSGKSTANYALSIGLGVVIFVFLTLYVGIISNEIANEKTSRIMEILLAATSPAIQFFGKILGVGLLAVLHATLYLVTILVLVLVLPNNEMVQSVTKSLTGIDVSFAIVTVLLVLVGIVLYMILTAIVAAMVNDQSQVQQAVAPVTYIGLIGYFMSFMASGQPKNVFFEIMSYVPFVSQTLMPARLGLEFATTWQAVIALLIEIVAAILLGRFGLRVYKHNVLEYTTGNVTKAALLSLKGLFKN